jgi:DNA invertase Pin-like site-specific DNA recombinase
MSDYVIAKYIRLSVDDGTSESMSIPHQQLLLDKAIDGLNISNATTIEFIDNGFTGTNLDRPGVQGLLELVQSGKVNCIIVKDFSRFSRNALESGYYIEQVFPLYDVRFIAIGENFDSINYKNETGGIDVAFKFIMHEYYSKDLSKKVKSAYHVKMKNGENITARATYGYRKNKAGKWELDPEAAKIVDEIFQLALDGMSTSQIRDKMCEARYMTPSEYANVKRGKDIMPTFMWTNKVISRILANEQYAGSYVAGKKEAFKIGTKKIVTKDRSDWIIIPDHHPAIISKDKFELLQKAINKPKAFAFTELASIKGAACLGHGYKARKSRLVPYGYKSTDTGVWEVDNVAAEVVKAIFKMYLQGRTMTEISYALCGTGYPTPLKHFNHTRDYKYKTANRWSICMVYNILNNIQYTGAYIAGKVSSPKNQNMPNDEWVIIPNKHQPIISLDDFNVAKAIRAISKKNIKEKKYLLRGKVLCGCCGYALSYNNSTDIAKYRCMHTLADKKAECHKMNVTADDLDEAVMAIIKKQSEVVLDSNASKKVFKKNEAEQMELEYREQIKYWINQRQKCYEQLILNEIDRDTHMKMMGEYTVNLNRINNQLAIIKQSEQNSNTITKINALAKEAFNETASPSDIVNALVDRVFVFPGNRIEIHWKFANFAEMR